LGDGDKKESEASEDLAPGTNRLATFLSKKSNLAASDRFYVHIIGAQNTPEKGSWRADQPTTEEYILDLRYHDHSYLTVTSTRSNYNRSLWINTVEFIHDARRHDYSRSAGRATRVRLMNPSKKKSASPSSRAKMQSRKFEMRLHSHNIGKESSRLRNGRFLFRVPQTQSINEKVRDDGISYTQWHRA
jgi:hypothetical protein